MPETRLTSRTYIAMVGESVCYCNNSVNYIEILNSLNPPGFPIQLLTLKVGTSIMLLKNLSPPKLCKGTCLRMAGLQNLLETKIMIGFT